MRNIRTRTKCIRVSSDKSSGVCRCYSDLQLRYLEKLDKDNDVKEVRLNVKLQDLDIEDTYSTDFVMTLKDGTTRIRECVLRKHLTKPLTIKLLDVSRVCWLSRGYSDWGIVIDENK